MDNSYIIALTLSTLAGLSTVIGAFVTFFIKQNSLKFLSFGLGLSAGVMIFVSLVDLYPEACNMIKNQFGDNYLWLAVLCLTLGMMSAVLIDFFIPDHIQGQMLSKQLGANENNCDSTDCVHDENAVISIGKIKKAGIITAIVVALHNLPEGLATFFISSQDAMIGLGVVIAIAIHNIPEGMAISIPVYQATHSKRKAFLYSFLSGMAEPIGGVVGFSLVQAFFPNLCIGILFAFVAGIMTYISLDTLLPLSRDYDTGHYSISGVVVGILVMGCTLVMLD